MEKYVLGIDIGGTGIKGNVVDVTTGEFVQQRIKIGTPKPATPDAVLSTVKKMIKSFDWEGKPIGIGFPAIVKDGVVLSASNIDDSWINYPINEKWSKALNNNVFVMNDADAAGAAEANFGKGKGVKGLVITLTLGTGIGSGFYYNGVLLPNTELGHIIYKKNIAEKVVSNSVRESKKMGWKTYGKLLSGYLDHVNFIFSPNLIILGGGISKNFGSYKDYIALGNKVTTAELLNDAGIIGAAVQAAKLL